MNGATTFLYLPVMPDFPRSWGTRQNGTCTGERTCTVTSAVCAYQLTQIQTGRHGTR